MFLLFDDESTINDRPNWWFVKRFKAPHKPKKWRKDCCSKIVKEISSVCLNNFDRPNGTKEDDFVIIKISYCWMTAADSLLIFLHKEMFEPYQEYSRRFPYNWCFWICHLLRDFRFDFFLLKFDIYVVWLPSYLRGKCNTLVQKSKNIRWNWFIS